MQAVGWLIGGATVAFLLIVGGFTVAGRTDVWRPAWLGLAITLPPAVLSMVLVIRLSRLSPAFGPPAVLAGTALRMTGAAVAVAVLGGKTESLGASRSSLAEWTTGFYLVLLTLETTLLWRTLTVPR